MYEKDIKILRFDLLEYLQTMIETQEQHMEGIYRSYKTPMGLGLVSRGRR